jgi:glycogen debranching enzyme
MRESGLRNQGWKDSEDAVFHADGRLAEAPIALCEVQGYAYLAFRLGARLAADFGDYPYAASLDAQAAALREQFEARFWCEELGTYALALDGKKQPCRVRSSNAGQLLFTGIVSEERAAQVARGLFGAEFFSGWGIRTISAREKRFNPTSYHNGSVWPHDNALIGLRRLPELFCGFDRKRGKAPTLYPVACAPQAWAACAPFALLQACLGMEIDCADSRLKLRRPRLPAFLDWLMVRRLQVGESRLDLLLQRHSGSVSVNLLSRDGDAEIEVML